ncbi:MAG: hypothetical protein H5U13_05410 [Parvibaculum sp.]|jgi:hypothetical protein|nr:hypothetical protein [Parvibaculum sp.]
MTDIGMISRLLLVLAGVFVLPVQDAGAASCSNKHVSGFVSSSVDLYDTRGNFVENVDAEDLEGADVKDCGDPMYYGLKTPNGMRLFKKMMVRGEGEVSCCYCPSDRPNNAAVSAAGEYPKCPKSSCRSQGATICNR